MYGLLTYEWHFGSKDTACKYFEGLDPPLAHQGWQRREHQMLDLRRKGNMGVGEEPAVRGRNPVGREKLWESSGLWLTILVISSARPELRRVPPHTSPTTSNEHASSAEGHWDLVLPNLQNTHRHR